MFVATEMSQIIRISSSFSLVFSHEASCHHFYSNNVYIFVIENINQLKNIINMKKTLTKMSNAKSLRNALFFSIFFVICTFSSNYCNAQASAVGKTIGKTIKTVQKARKIKTHSSKTHTYHARPRLILVKCNSCDGTGKVTTYNYYYGWVMTKCSNCNGSGRVHTPVRF